MAQRRVDDTMAKKGRRYNERRVDYRMAQWTQRRVDDTMAQSTKKVDYTMAQRRVDYTMAQRRVDKEG